MLRERTKLINQGWDEEMGDEDEDAERKNKGDKSEVEEEGGGS